jgi:hypothetical protein
LDSLRFEYLFDNTHLKYRSQELQHTFLSHHCFRVLESTLWLRIIDGDDMSAPGMLFDAIRKPNATPAVAYAACNLVYHLQRTATGPSNTISLALINRFAIFTERYLPLWVEFHYSANQGKGLSGAADLLSTACVFIFKVGIIFYESLDVCFTYNSAGSEQ